MEYWFLKQTGAHLSNIRSTLHTLVNSSVGENMDSCMCKHRYVCHTYATLVVVTRINIWF